MTATEKLLPCPFCGGEERRDDLQRANAENAKLRELVRDMCVWAYIDSDCDLEDRFANRMRDLGIEVDE